MVEAVRQRSRKGTAIAALFALIGPVASVGLLTAIPKDEGTKYVAYYDLVHKLTICSGDTYDVVPGMKETEEGCEERTARQILAHVAPVVQCLPAIRAPNLGYTRWALGSFAYNLGPGRVCRGPVYAAASRGNWVGACRAIRTPGFATAGGRYIRGLDLRRRREEQICLTGLLPGYTPDNLSGRLKVIR